MFKDDKPVINKIEIDEKSSEPKIVSVPDENLDESEYALGDSEIPDLSIAEEAQKTSVGKQLVMNRILGVDEKRDKDISKRQRFLKRLFTAVFIVFVVGVLSWTFYKDFFADAGTREPFNWNVFGGIISSCWYYLVFAILALAFCFFFKGLKLSVMCKAMTGHFHFRTCFETAIIGHYYNSITPLAVGGQPFEIYHLSKHGIHGGVASSMPIAAFFLNQLAFVVLSTISLSMYPSNSLGIPETFLKAFSGYSSVFMVLGWIGLVCCLLMPSLTVIFSIFPSLGTPLVHFVMWLGSKFHIVKKPKETTYRTVKTVIHNSRCLKKLATSPFVFIATFLISLGEQIALGSIAYFTLKFFGLNMEIGGIMEWLIILQFCFIIYAAVSFIPTPGNSGAADLSFFILFETGIMAGLAFPAMAVWRFLSFYSFILVGFIFTTLKRKSDKKHELLNIHEE